MTRSPPAKKRCYKWTIGMIRIATMLATLIIGLIAGRRCPCVREGGSRLCFVRDPDDYRIELIERS